MSVDMPAPRRIDIRAMRERFGLTQADIADELHVDERTVRRWERGASSPSPMAIAHMRSMQQRMKAKTESGADPEATTPSAPASEPAGLPRRRLPTL